MPLLKDRERCDRERRLNTKLFAHIHSDSRLVGTNLEGNTFLETAGYVEKVLKYLLDEKNKTGISDKTRKEIQANIAKTESLFKQLIDNEKAIERFIFAHNSLLDSTDYATVESGLQSLTLGMVDQFESSKTGELLLPGGWSGKPSGHAMAYKLKKEKDGSITFLVYNTGSGINNHLTQTTSKDKYLPVDAYKIPAGVKKEDLAHYLQGLMAPQILPRLERVNPYKYEGDWNKDTKFDADKVYSNIKKIAFLGGKKIDARKFFNHFTQGQLSGTCSMRVLMPILQESLEGMAFKQTLYQFRLQSILDFYSNCKANMSLGRPEVQRQLRRALDKFAETTRKYSLRTKNPVITTEQAEESLEMIKQIRVELDKDQKQTLEGQAALHSFRTRGITPNPVENLVNKVQDPTFVFKGGPGLSLDVKEKKERKDEPQLPLPDIKSFSSPLEYLQSCQYAIEQNANQHYTDVVLDNVEKMMLAIPITSPEAENYWKKLSIRGTKEALSTLQSIMRTYGKHCHLKGGYAFPQRWLTAASGMFIAGQIANVHFGNDPNFDQLAGFIENAVRNKELVGDPYSVSRDPKFDGRLKELKENWEKVKGIALRKVGMTRSEHYDIELVKKHQLETQFSKVPADADVSSGYDSVDKARIQLYRLAQGKLKSEEARMGETLDNLDFCCQFDEFCKECGLFEVGGFDYFTNVPSQTDVDKRSRLSKLGIEAEEGRHIDFSHKSNFKYHNGVRVVSSFTSDVSTIYDIQDPILQDELFAKKYNYFEFGDEERPIEATGDYNFESNRALLHFNGLAKKLDKEQFPDYPAKALPFTRINQETRIVATLDFFESHLEYFNDKDKQNLCLLNLLTSSAFINQVENVPSIADKWVSLVEKEVKFHTRGNKIEPGAMFSLTLSYYLLKYLNSTKNPHQFTSQIQRLQKLDQFILDNIDLHSKIIANPALSVQDKDSSASHRKDLELLYLLRNSEILTHQDRWGEKEIKAVMRGIFCRQNLATKRGQVLNPFIENELDTGTLRLQPLLLKHLSSLPDADRNRIVAEVVNEFLVPTVIPDKNYKIQGKLPIYTLQHEKGTYTIDIGRGSVKTGQYLYKTIPTEFYTKDFIEFFGEREFQGKIILSSSIRMCEFTADGKEYRLILDDKGKVHIQTTFGAEKKWYELQDKKELRGDLDDGIANTKKLIPRHFLEKERYIWGEIGNPPKEYLVTDKQGNFFAELQRRAPTEQEKKEITQKTYNQYMDTKWNEDKFKAIADNLFNIYELNKDGGRNHFRLCMVATTLSEQSLLANLTQFEDSDFMEIWESESKYEGEKKMKINLTRYGLQFEVENVNGVKKLKCNNYPGFHLVTDPVTSIYNFSNVLYLEKTGTKERIALVPKQVFHPIDKSTMDGEYYYLTLDTSNNIPAMSLEGIEPGDWHWKYTNAESTAVFKLDENNQFIGTTTEEWLQIAYLALAKHQPDKAMNALIQCQKLGGLKGTAIEVEWIKKIMSEIPDPNFKNQELTKKATTNEPETLAVRLRAAALLADFKNMSLDTPKFDLSLPKGQKQFESYNERYQDQKKNELIQFYKEGFQNVATGTYVDYYKVMGNLPDNLRLSTSLELSLLRQTFKKIPRGKAFGFVQGRWRKLELVELRKEHNILIKKKASQNNTLSTQDEKRLKHIAEILERGNPYLVGVANLTDKTFTLDPSLPNFEGNQISLLRNVPLTTYKVERVYKPKDLHPNMHVNNFLFSFESLYNLAKAQDSKSNHEEREILKKFLDNMIQVWAQQEAPEHGTPVSELCILLKYVIENPGTWPEFASKNAVEAKMILENMLKNAKEIATRKGPYKITTQVYEEESQAKRATVKSYDTKIQRETGDLLAKPKILVSSAPPLQQILAKPQEYIIANESDVPEVRESYHLVTKSEVKTTSDMPEIFTKGQFKDQFLIEEVKRFNEDYKAGVRLNTLISEKREITKKCFKEQVTRQTLQTNLNRSSEKLETSNKIALEAILKLANKALLKEAESKTGLEGKRVSEEKYKKELSTRLKVAAGKKKLELGDLITLYLQCDLARFKKETKLEEKEVLELYQKFHNHLLESTKLNHQKRVLKKLEKLGTKTESDPTFESAINELGEELFTKRSFDPSVHPEMLIFEFLDDKYIRDPQLKMITDLLKKEGDGYANKIIQMIMGGGKSKVIMPLVALKKANGTNLSMIIVPSALYETNVADLQAVSQRLFGQQAYEFRFSREKALDSADLKARYKKMWQVIRDKGYMISTPESIQSLELRYLELLDTPPGSDASQPVKEEWAEQLKTLDKMLKLIKNRGDALIDEVDSILDPKKELNFTIGGESEVSDVYLNMIIGLYNLLPDVVVETPQGSIPLEDILQGRREIVDIKFWNEAKELLAKQMIEHPKSPIFDIVNKLTADNRRILQSYFLDTEDKVPNFIRLLDEGTRNRIGLMKAEMQILPMTLQRKKDENYGFAKDPKAGVPTDIAIPYLANNVPNHRSQFGSYIETINFTLQLHRRNEKIAPGVLKAFINDFYVRANNEVTLSLGTIQFTETESYREFNRITGRDLNMFDPRNDSQLENLRTELSIASPKNKEVVDYCLTHYVLKKIKQHKFILRSDAVNHVSQYRSVQGMTGTPWNYRCFNKNLNFSPEETLGVDGQTMHHLLRKHTHIRKTKETDPKKIIATLFDEPGKIGSLRSFIDIGALFHGVSNIEVAKLLAIQIRRQQGNEMTHVLYFNEENILCALPIQENAEPIVIGSSDPEVINAKTGSTPRQRFTYFDQHHTTGTDILQMPNALAYATIDNKTLARDFWQGVMRMRGLNSTQNIEVLLPPSVTESGDPTKEWNINDVARFVLNNQFNKLAELHYQGAVQNMNDIVRQHFLSLVYFQKTPEEKAALYQKFSTLFLMKGVEEPFAQFGEIERPAPKAEAFEALRKDFFDRWKSLLTQPPKTIVPTNVQEINIQKELKEVGDKAVACCKDQVQKLEKYQQGATVEVQKEKEKEKEKEKLKELLQIASGSEPALKRVARKSWELYDLSRLEDVTRASVKVHPLNAMLVSSNPKEPTPSWKFDDTVLVSENFMNTHETQKDKLDAFTKPVNFYLLIQDPPPSKLRAMIITQEEAVEFANGIKNGKSRLKDQKKNYWVVSPHDSLFYGTQADLPTSHPDFFRLKEQVCYFNADLDVIAESAAQFKWLQRDNQAKMDYLESRILPNHPGKQKAIKPLLQAFSQAALTNAVVHALDTKNGVELKSALDNINEIKNVKEREKLLNARTKEGYTLLGYAVKMNDANVVNTLLRHQDINPLLPDALGRIPLSIAVEGKDKAMLSIMLTGDRFFPPQKQVDAWNILLLAALKANSTDLLKSWLAKVETFDKEIQKEIKTKLLFELINTNQVEIIKQLIANGNVDLSLRGASGHTPLEAAMVMQNEVLTRVFMQNPSAYPHRDEDAWALFLNKLVRLKEERLFSDIIDRALIAGDKNFIFDELMNRMNEAQKTKNIHSLNLLVNYFSGLCRKRDADTPKILSAWNDIFQRTILDGDYEGMNVLLRALKALPNNQGMNIIKGGGRVKDRVVKWINITVPNLKDPDYVQQGKLRIFQQLSADPDFALESYGRDVQAWRTLLSDAIQFSNPSFVRQILTQIGRIPEVETRQQIVGWIKSPYGATYDGPLSWSSLVLQQNPGADIVSKQRAIIQMLETIPELFPNQNDTSAWNALLRSACDSDIQSEVGQVIFSKFETIRENKIKQAVLQHGTQGTAGLMPPTPLIVSAMENNNYALYPMLVRQGIDPNAQDISGNTVLHILFRNFKNLANLQDWLPIVLDPQLKVNTVNHQKETPVMQLLYMAEEINQQKISRDQKSLMYNRWLDCLTTVVNRNDTDLSIRTPANGTVLDIVSDLPIDEVLKRRVTDVLSSKMQLQHQQQGQPSQAVVFSKAKQPVQDKSQQGGRLVPPSGRSID